MNNSIMPYKEYKIHPCMFDRIKYYKPQLFGHKWKDCYAILWPSSHFKWYSKKSRKSFGLINIEKAVPYIYTGVHTCKIPAKQPSLPLGYFTRNLVAISLDKEAKHVLWFLFDTTSNLNIWVSAIKRTVPRLNPSFYNVELGSVTGHSFTLSRNNSEKKRRLRRSYSNASDCYPLTPTVTNYGYANSGKLPYNRAYNSCYSSTNAEIIFIGGDGYSGVESDTPDIWLDFPGGDYGTCGSGVNGGYGESDTCCGSNDGDGGD